MSPPPPPPPPEQSCSTAAGVKTAIRELAHGREAALRLEALLRGSVAGERLPPPAAAGALAEEVLASILKALLALEYSGGSSAALLRSPAVPASGDPSLWAGKRKARSARDRKGGRRRRSASDSWTVPAKTVDDGHGWRKYGQKSIQSDRYQRSYFRCKHKFDLGCQAIRQVQRSSEDPSTFLITYLGHHTCTSSSTSGHHAAGRPLLINFGAPREQPVVRSPGARSQQAPAAGLTGPPLPPAAAEQECVVDEDARSKLSRHDSSSEYFTLPEMAALGNMPFLLPAAASDVAGDATSGLDSSCVSPCCSLDMDLGVDCIQVDDMLDLDGDDLVLSFIR